MSQRKRLLALARAFVKGQENANTQKPNPYTKRLYYLAFEQGRKAGK